MDRGTEAGPRFLWDVRFHRARVRVTAKAFDVSTRVQGKLNVDANAIVNGNLQGRASAR